MKQPRFISGVFHGSKYFFLLFFLLGCSDITAPIKITGDYFLVIKNENYNIEVGKISVDGSQYETIYRPYNPGPHDNVNFAQLAPDQSTIVINGGPNQEYGYSPIWLMSMNGELLNQVTTNGWWPRWSLDGKWLYYSKYIAPASSGLDLYRYNIKEQTEELLLYAGNSDIHGELHFFDYLLSDVNPTNINEIIVKERDFLLDEDYYVISESARLMKFNVVTGQKEYLNIQLDSLIIGIGSINSIDNKLYFTSSDTASWYRGFFHSYDFDNEEVNPLFSPDERERVNTFTFSPAENKVVYFKIKFITLPDYSPDRIHNIIVRDLLSNTEEIILTPEREVKLMQWIVSDD